MKKLQSINSSEFQELNANLQIGIRGGAEETPLTPSDINVDTLKCNKAKDVGGHTVIMVDDRYGNGAYLLIDGIQY